MLYVQRYIAPPPSNQTASQDNKGKSQTEAATVNSSGTLLGADAEKNKTPTTTHRLK